MGFFDTEFPVQFLIHKTYHNSKIKYYNDMKLGSDTERNKGNMVTSKKLTVTPRRQFEKNVSFFNFYWICSVLDAGI